MKELQQINIGLIGFGTIGTGVVKVLQGKAEIFEKQIGKRIILKKIADLDIVTKRDVVVDQQILTTNAKEILEDPDIDVVIELMGGYEPARTFILTALRNGKDVITANKALLSKYWQEIFATAQETQQKVYFEASVGGGIPLISSISSGLCANQITSIFGIINGTCNYILTKMTKEGREMTEVLEEAKNAGYAEANPILDIEGHDTAHKISVLTTIAFGQHISNEQIYTEGITSITYRDILYADELGYTIKLLGIAKKIEDEIEIRVHPTMIPKNYLLSSVTGVYNAVYVEGDLTGPLIFYGKGAGQMPTASAVVANLISLVQGENSIAHGWKYTDDFKVKRMADILSKYYIRFSVADCPGVLASISGILGEYNISIASVIQKERGECVSIIMLIHEAKEGNLQEALKKIAQLEVIKKKSLVIRVEDMNWVNGL